MGQLLLFIVVALVVASILFGVTVMLSGNDSGLTPVDADGRSVTLPSDRPLGEEDIVRTRFDTALRGYRMNQVDSALQRAAYDIGYKGELIGVLEAEVAALREGRSADADVLRKAREAAIAPPPAGAPDAAPATEVPSDGKVIELTPEVPADDPTPTAAPADDVNPKGSGFSAPSVGPGAGGSTAERR
jgi:DivIVA domain-containing protein